MIYKTYFDVPDGAMCRPIKVINVGEWLFDKKESWANNEEYAGAALLGEWETQEKSINITMTQFNEAHDRLGLHKYSPNANALRHELFKGVME